MEAETGKEDTIEVIRSTLPELFLESHMLEEELEESNFSEKEYAALVLNTMTDLSGEEAANKMDVSEGRYWGALGRANTKVEEAQQTLELASL